MAGLEFSRGAVLDVEEITASSRQSFGTDVTDAYLVALAVACVRLRDFPEMGAVYPRIKPVMRCLIYRRHRIFYRFEADVVSIVRILHHARDVKRAMK